MKKLFLLILIVLLAVAFFTNPDEQKHEEAAKAKFEQVARATMDDYGIGNNILAALGLDASKMLSNLALDEIIYAKNYIFFSTTKLKWMDKDYVIGVGAFGKVYIFKQVDDILKEQINNAVGDIFRR